MTTKPIDLSQFANATPGPWRHDEAYAIDSNLGTVAYCHSGPPKHVKANGDLIAAAPALVKELQEVREMLQATTQTLENLSHDMRRYGFSEAAISNVRLSTDRNNAYLSQL